MLVAEAKAGKVMVAEAEQGLLMAEAEAGKMIVAEANRMYDDGGGREGVGG